MPAITGGLIAGGGALLGGILGGNAARDAAATSANAQKYAASLSAFRPVGITTRFGSSQFEMQGDKLKSAGYTLSPEMQAIQDQIMGYTRSNLSDAGTLQDLARGYLAQTPEQAASQYMLQQQGLLSAGREKQLADIKAGLFGSGRGGLSVSQGSGSLGLKASNPELQAYYNALASQDAQLAAQADQYGRERTNYGIGLMSSAYQPFTTSLGLVSQIESLGQTPLSLGAELGGRSADAGANVAQGLIGAAKTMQQANSYSPWGSAISGFTSNPYVQQMFNKPQYNPVQPGQYTPGSNTFVGPMPQSSGMFNAQPDASGATSNQYWL